MTFYNWQYHNAILLCIDRYWKMLGSFVRSFVYYHGAVALQILKHNKIEDKKQFSSFIYRSLFLLRWLY